MNAIDRIEWSSEITDADKHMQTVRMTQTFISQTRHRQHMGCTTAEGRAMADKIEAALDSLEASCAEIGQDAECIETAEKDRWREHDAEADRADYERDLRLGEAA